MASPLDFITESHEGPEPRVLTEDVQQILRAVIRPGDEDTGKSVALIAQRARVSTRTVYRVLNPEEGKTSISLDLADKLTLAAGSHASHCRLEWPDGRITGYRDDDAGTL
jgi:AraC-like DNA-binding protein